MQALRSIARKIAVFLEGLGPSAKNRMQRLQLRKWLDWVSGKSPMPDKSQRMALASTALVALVVVVVLVAGASTVLRSPSHHAPVAAPSATGNGPDAAPPDLSDFRKFESLGFFHRLQFDQRSEHLLQRHPPTCQTEGDPLAPERSQIQGEYRESQDHQADSDHRQKPDCTTTRTQLVRLVSLLTRTSPAFRSRHGHVPR